MSPSAATVSLLEADSDLGAGLPSAELERATRAATTRVQGLRPGERDATTAIESDVHHRGFLIAEGLMSRDVEVLAPPVRGAARPRRRHAPVVVGRARLPRTKGAMPGRFFDFDRVRTRTPTDPDVNTPDPTPIDA